MNDRLMHAHKEPCVCYVGAVCMLFTLLKKEGICWLNMQYVADLVNHK